MRLASQISRSVRKSTRIQFWTIIRWPLVYYDFDPALIGSWPAKLVEACVSPAIIQLRKNIKVAPIYMDFDPALIDSSVGERWDWPASQISRSMRNPAKIQEKIYIKVAPVYKL